MHKLLQRLFGRLHHPAKAAPPQRGSASDLKNPYHRMYTDAPTLEALARRAREQQKNSNKQ